MKSILDREFRYTPSFDTDIRKNFDAAKKRLEEQQQRTKELTEAAEKLAREIAAEAQEVVAKTRIKGKAP